MEPLTFRDTQNLLQAIQELNSVRDLDSFGIKVLTIINRLVESEIPVFHLNRFQSNRIIYTFLPDRPSLTPEMEEVPRRYWGEHPITQNMPDTLHGAYKISDFVTRRALHQLEGLYQQFLRLLDCEDMMCLFLLPSPPQNWSEALQRKSIAAYLQPVPADASPPQNPAEVLQQDAEMVGITLSRAQRNFTERDRTLLNLLRPHLLQAYSNLQYSQQLQQSLTQLHQSCECLNLVILNEMGQIQFISPSADQWLQSYFSPRTSPKQLPDHLASWVRHQISSLSHQEDPPKVCLPLRIEQAGKQLVIRLIIEQVGEQYLLLLEEKTLTLFDSLELLGLSQRETEVLYWVIRGDDNQAIAKRLTIHIGTVRKHLESIFRKLGVQSRTEAVSRALEQLGVLNSPPIL